MSWDAPFKAPEPGVGIGLSKLAFKEESGRQEVIEEMKKLADGLQQLGNQARKDSKDVLDYLWLSVCEEAAEVDQVNCRLVVLKDDVGDATPLSKLHNINNLAEGAVKARWGVWRQGSWGRWRRWGMLSPSLTLGWGMSPTSWERLKRAIEGLPRIP